LERPHRHNQYLQAFNRGNGTRWDAGGQDIDGIVESRVAAGGMAHPSTISSRLRASRWVLISTR
ncbi:MAG: hypothetical protein P8N17_08755, partial [Luminiphilus sp.]|nr:hypothetical protein [Luminiphilus sp.]